VMTMRSDMPDFATQAKIDLQKRVHELAVAKGLVDGSFYYGADLSTGDIMVPAGYEAEFDAWRKKVADIVSPAT